MSPRGEKPQGGDGSPAPSLPCELWGGIVCAVCAGPVVTADYWEAVLTPSFQGPRSVTYEVTHVTCLWASEERQHGH